MLVGWPKENNKNGGRAVHGLGADTSETDIPTAMSQLQCIHYMSPKRRLQFYIHRRRKAYTLCLCTSA